MKKITYLDSVYAFNVFNQFEVRHPLVNIVDWSKATISPDCNVHLELYCIALSILNNQEGRLSFIAPSQTIGFEDTTNQVFRKGHALVFHPDLITGTAFAEHLNVYHFFQNNSHQVLQLSQHECKIVSDCFAKIEFELSQTIDKHSKKLLTTHVELFLNYCERFYDRQFTPPDHMNWSVVKSFKQLLNHYFKCDNLIETGIPSVAYFADKLNISANYFGDLIKKEAGKSAQEYIKDKIIDEAKNKIYDRSKSINEIAYELGFKYPQHFSRFFKRYAGLSPNEFRVTNIHA